MSAAVFARVRGRIRRRRRAVRAAILLLVVTALGAHAVFYLFDSARLTAASQALLQNLTGAKARVGSARLTLNGLILTSVQLRVPGDTPAAQRLLEIDRVQIKHTLGGLLHGRIIPTQLVFEEPHLYVTELLDQQTYNYQLLLPSSQSQSHNANLPENLPEVILQDGHIHLGQINDGAYQQLDTLRIDGHLTADYQRSGGYNFQLRQIHDNGSSGPLLSGKVNLSDLSFYSQLENFSFESPQRALLPERLRQWWDRLQPEGALPTIRVSYHPDPKVGYSAELEIRNGGVTLPYGELDFRLRQVSGKFAVKNDELTISGLKGRIENVYCELDGRADNLRDDAPFTLNMRIEGELPENPEYLPALPGVVQKHYRRFMPSGTFRGQVQVSRTEEAGPISYHGGLELIEAKATYAKFAYPLQQIRGRLEFNEKQVRIIDVHAQGQSGGRLLINGTITPPRDHAEAHFTIVARDVPIDDSLRSALKPEIQRVYDAFITPELHQQWRDKGLLLSRAEVDQAKADLVRVKAGVEASLKAGDQQRALELGQQALSLQKAAALPGFDLGGTVDCLVEVDRPWGPDQRTQAKVNIDIQNVGVMFSKWPYPATITQARIVAQPPRVLVESATARGLTGARVQATGVIDQDKQTGKVIPDLQVQLEDAPLDRLMLASVPEKQQQMLEQLHLNGLAKATGKVFRRENEPIDFAFDVELAGGSSRPFGGSYALENATGRLHLQHDELTIHEIRAAHDASELSVAGAIRFDREKSSTHLEVTGRQLRFEDPVADLLPPGLPQKQSLLRLFDRHQPAGLFNASVSYTDEPSKPAVYRVAIQPESLSFDHQRQRIELRQMAGQVLALPGQIQLENLAGTYSADSQGKLEIDGQIMLGQGESVRDQAELKLQASGSKLDAATLALLPSSLRSILDQLRVQGTYQLRDATVRLNPANGNELEVTGLVDLTQGSLSLGAPITDLISRIQFNVQRESGSRHPWLQVAIDANQLAIAGRPVGPLNVELATKQNPAVIELTRFEGEACSGRLSGRGQIQLNEPAQYKVELTLENAQLGPIVRPLTPELPGAEQQEGIVSANLSLHGQIGNPDLLQGRGQVIVREANLYRVPLAMALLQLINLSLPTNNAFNAASITFLINGDLIRFDEMAFRTRNLEMSGSGTMRYSTRALDLELSTHNPRGMDLGPLSDMMHLVKKELLSVHVGGTLDKPEPSVKSFSGLRQSIDRVFDGEPVRQRRPAPPAVNPSSESQ